MDWKKPLVWLALIALSYAIFAGIVWLIYWGIVQVNNYIDHFYFSPQW